VGEESVGHVLVEEGGGADEVQCYSLWSVQIDIPSASILPIGRLNMARDVRGDRDWEGDKVGRGRAWLKE
jgi:hypothetical protein